MQKVSVILPAYNRVRELERAIESVLKQQAIEVQLIVVDDGSDENLDLLAARVRNAGGCFISQPRAGVAAARNAGLAVAEAEWIACLDSDDYWLPDKLQIQIAYHLTNPGFLLSQTDEIWLRNNQQVNKKKMYSPPEGDIFEQCLERCCISPSSILLHRSVLDECGCFDERMPGCEDYDLWIRIASRFPVGWVAETLAVKTAGHVDQLSLHFPAMDRFRVFSLLKLLETKQLNAEQEQLTWQQVRKKLEILRIGGQKRHSNIGSTIEKLSKLLDSTITSDCQTLVPIMDMLQASWQLEFDQFLQRA